MKEVKESSSRTKSEVTQASKRVSALHLGLSPRNTPNNTKRQQGEHCKPLQG